ncbi:MAG: alanyl-tRNA synthetase [Saprospiraceae bacterium]|jgi:alanyl-tRNA synthetase
MKANEIRKTFFDFFERMEHKIVPSAPIVNKDDPTLMFTNAGMNQFKDYFLGNRTPEVRRMADTQKCLRVSGKHNDLEEVGIDSYHHTMFEMLGNWSFGDYFKKEAIEWAWKLLTEEFNLAPERLYVSVFEGDKNDGLEADNEAVGFWQRYVPKERILYFDHKDNFWEMGETGPCGPCSEIHIDLRSEEDRKKTSGASLVNADDPLVVEIWNLVFIQFNRKADGSLEDLPEKHIDTGMGFERLCMAIQGTKSNYDTDLFRPFIKLIEDLTGKKYEGNYALEAKKDIAFRVLVDHVRAVSFTIADGQLPSNTGAGYVIRRILRRAVRYYYTFLDCKEPLMYKMLPLLADSFKDVFPELTAQLDFVSKIILEEEKSFLRTLEGGLKRLSQISIQNGILEGGIAFELYDTYGFPIDLTRLIGQESGWEVDDAGFEVALQEQKSRSRADAKKEAGDWVELMNVDEVLFEGYDHNSLSEVQIVKYRTIKVKDKEVYQVVLDRTPFYAESGGQVGDKGVLQFGEEEIKVNDTQKENDLIIHNVNQLPSNIGIMGSSKIDINRRRLIQNNHTATHLLHAALREVLGDHVQQRGSLVNEKQLRFDFSHFEKMSEVEIEKVEAIVNRKIGENIALQENRNLPIEAAKEAGAMMLFGEKYGEFVRMVIFDSDYSKELCGGCHVGATGEIGLFKLKSESAIAAGVRRIEALTSVKAVAHVNGLIQELNDIKSLFKNPTNTVKNVKSILEENKVLEKTLLQFKAEKASSMKDDLLEEIEVVNGVKYLGKVLQGIDMSGLKTLAYNIEQSVGDVIVLFGIEQGGKANLQLLISKNLIKDNLKAGQIIRQISKNIQGGGGGQDFFATAGGKNPDGLDRAIEEGRSMITSNL